MMKHYNITADLLVLAKAYYDKGQKKDSVKLFIRAMDEADSDELVEYLDETNQDLDPTITKEEETEEVLSDEEVDELLEETTEAEEEETETEAEAEEETETEAEEETVELPEVEEIVSKVMKKKSTLANLKSLSGTTSARKSAIAKFLKK